LAYRIDKALRNSSIAHGFQGILIESLKDGRIIYERNSRQAFIPASNMKLVVSAAALELLGPDFVMKTSLCISGNVTSDGKLVGNLYLVGGGDPLLKSSDLYGMVIKLKQAGIKLIEGNIVGDDTLFDDVRLGPNWCWDDEPYYYAAQISALNLNKNVVDIWVRPADKVGEPACVTINPPTKYLTVVNECKTSKAGSEKSITIDRVHGQNIVRIRGVIPLDYNPTSAEEAITVDNPTLYACHILANMLLSEGIQIKGKTVVGKCPSTGVREIAVHHSLPLSQIIAFMNKASDNLIAECLLKTLGARFKGQGTTEAGREVVLEFLKQIGLDMSAVGMVDGSGLSRQNLISPGNLVLLLKHMFRHRYKEVFISSLAVGGVDGTLKNRMKGTICEGNVKAKTGYLNRVSTISGFLTTKSGEPLVFSIMMNNHLCKNIDAIKVQDEILNLVAGM
jgi:D-alanyl-D-alanine carboxypeptidase/D-alanyl-D-alanine-endopeptidase (penicillin-binding protein 4)